MPLAGSASLPYVFCAELSSLMKHASLKVTVRTIIDQLNGLKQLKRLRTALTMVTSVGSNIDLNFSAIIFLTREAGPNMVKYAMLLFYWLVDSPLVKYFTFSIDHHKRWCFR